ncbi:hypothetical protein COD94_03835 [Bacillus cereus]|jgi:hypothetical protein|nr:hypothetical protein COD94_03835 [Bacillus cereus]
MKKLLWGIFTECIAFTLLKGQWIDEYQYSILKSEWKGSTYLSNLEKSKLGVNKNTIKKTLQECLFLENTL